jgi:cytidyltransferase-like protein
MSDRQLGVILGRFQPFHIGHLEFANAAKKRCDRLVIGITNPAIARLATNDAPLDRKSSASNPFTFFQRLEMIEGALVEEGWRARDFAIVPADIDTMGSLGSYLPEPRRSKVYVTIYDQWGEEKVQKIVDEGYEIEILWRRSMADRATSGTEVRSLIETGSVWSHLVPKGAIEPILRFADQIIAKKENHNDD